MRQALLTGTVRFSGIAVSLPENLRAKRETSAPPFCLYFHIEIQGGEVHFPSLPGCCKCLEGRISYIFVLVLGVTHSWHCLSDQFLLD